MRGRAARQKGRPIRITWRSVPSQACEGIALLLYASVARGRDPQSVMLLGKCSSDRADPASGLGPAAESNYGDSR